MTIRNLPNNLSSSWGTFFPFLLENFENLLNFPSFPFFPNFDLINSFLSLVVPDSLPPFDSKALGFLDLNDFVAVEP